MKNENKSIVITSIISGVILIIALGALFLFGNNFSQKNTVTVEGISSIKATPDLISVYFTIETTANTSSEAKDLSTKIYNKILDGIVAQGFSKEDLKTDYYNIYPNIRWEDGETVEDGYKVSHSVKVEMSADKTDKLLNVVDVGVDAGAGIGSINFELSQDAQNKYKAQALELASKDAQIKADAVASGFNKKAGKLVSVQVSEFGYYPWNLYSAKAGGYAEDIQFARETAMNIQPTEQEINARVSATFKIN